MLIGVSVVCNNGTYSISFFDWDRTNGPVRLAMMARDNVPKLPRFNWLYYSTGSGMRCTASDALCHFNNLFMKFRNRKGLALDLVEANGVN